MLPDMHHLVDEQRLVGEAGGREVVAVARAVRVEMDRAGRRHHRLAWLEEGPFAPCDAHPGIIYRLAEHAPGERDLAFG